MPYLSPISENGRPLSSVCSFCGGSAGVIQSLDCGNHFICDSCVRQRGIYSICPLCANRDKHAIESSHSRGELLLDRRSCNSHSVFPNLDAKSSSGVRTTSSNPPTAAQPSVYCDSQISGPSLSAGSCALPVYRHATPSTTNAVPVSLSMSADPPLFGTPVLDFSSSAHSPSVFHTTAAPPAMPIEPAFCPDLDLQSPSSRRSASPSSRCPSPTSIPPSLASEMPHRALCRSPPETWRRAPAPCTPPSLRLRVSARSDRRQIRRFWHVRKARSVTHLQN